MTHEPDKKPSTAGVPTPPTKAGAAQWSAEAGPPSPPSDPPSAGGGEASPGGVTPTAYRPPLGLVITRRLSTLFGSRTVYLIVLSAIIGVGGGYGAIVFRWLIHTVNDLAYPGGIKIEALFAIPWWMMLAVPAAGGAAVGPLVYFFAREAKGHGVPEVMDAVANQGGRIRPRVALVKILASAVSIGVGAAVGREGPIVQIGSSLGSTLGQFLHVDARAIKLLVGCGAAAGIAATFNAPIAGAIFAIEVILGMGTIRMFTPLVVSSVVATAISRYHLGDFPAFEVPQYSLVGAWELGLYVLLGVVAAFVGVGFSRGLYKVEDFWNRLPIHDALKPVLGGVLIGGIALFFPHVMGVGYETIDGVLASNTSIGLTLLLGILVAKILATHLSLASGFSGGIFAPSLFLGAMLGGAFGIGASELLPPGTVAPSGAYALVAMGAVVAAGTHAPLTAILIVFEMTSDYRIILPLMLACFIASTLSLRLSRDSIYTLKLARRGSRIGRRAADEVMLATRVEAYLRPVEHAVGVAASFLEVVERALESEGRPIYVVETEGRIRGAIRLDDVSALIRDEEILQHLLVAEDVMRPVPDTIRTDDTLARCLRRLGPSGQAELPVVDDQCRLVGTISRQDILALYDREVLQREAALLTFVEAGDRESAGVVGVPSGECVERISVTARLAGRTLRDLNLRARYQVHVLGLRHRTGEGEAQAKTQVPEPGEALEAGDVLVVSGPPERIQDVRRLLGEAR